MYSKLYFILFAESIRNIHLQGLIREIYGISMDCLKEKIRIKLSLDNARTESQVHYDNYDKYILYQSGKYKLAQEKER